MKIRDRIIDFRRIKASELVPNEANWRKHPENQRTALAAAIEEIGFADVAIAREVNGHLELIDGHLRRDLAGDEEIPVVVVDLDDEEAKKLLLTLDPLSAMAETDEAKVAELLESVEFESEELQRLIAETPAKEEAEPQLKKLDIKPPPRMTWVLIGVPTVRFGEIAEDMERIAMLPDVVFETTVNDG